MNLSVVDKGALSLALKLYLSDKVGLPGGSHLCQVHTPLLDSLVCTSPSKRLCRALKKHICHLLALLMFMERGSRPNHVFCSCSLLFETHDYNSV